MLPYSCLLIYCLSISRLPLAASANLLVRSQLKPIRLSTTQLFDSSNFVHITYSYTIQFQLQLPSTEAISLQSFSCSQARRCLPNFLLIFNVKFLLSQNVLLCRISSLQCSLQNFGVSSRFPLFFSILLYISTALNFAVYIASFGIQGMLIFSIYSVPPLVYCNLFTLFLHMSSACVWFNELLANSFSITFSSFPLFLSLNSCLLLMRRTFV
jgi:hypothetical protein